ncbi:MAG: symmetrical bis(5'-nucleosyl)-tetraphosphatase [Ostreibacterium sp.]
MSTYFIGDVHGCYDELMQLLTKIQFDSAHDNLIFVGDLINRGPRSLDVLRFVRSLGKSAQVVLGNHDISLLAYSIDVYHGRDSDFKVIMQAHDATELTEWLRRQPLLIHDEPTNIIVTHAGIAPRWSIKKAIKQARKAEKKLRGDDYQKYLKKAYSGEGTVWSKSHDSFDKFRYRINGFTRLRYCREDGEPDFKDKCSPREQRGRLQPWFKCRERLQNDADALMIFGHWAALGFYHSANAICLDSGCVWGQRLTAIKVRKKKIECIQVEAL